jgi:hypothetical protein
LAPAPVTISAWIGRGHAVERLEQRSQHHEQGRRGDHGDQDGLHQAAPS